MGAVYLAVRDDDQYRKQVAIKVMSTAGDPDLLVRFRAERQIMAGFDHPNIARLLDGGALDDSRPYFVMEYIAGRRIDTYVAEKRLDTAAVLRLFLKVCAAVQFAHENLVVHRDLKAGNILVSDNGDPHLLDFGIAKVLDPVAHADLEATRTLMRRLTPISASPEQAAGAPVTAASDVYSLGILLYRLLTNVSAYAGAKDFESDPARVIREYEPPPASRAPGVPPKLRRVLAGDLDNIVRKAIEKEPGWRYGSVAELAADIERYLQGRPVRARQGSAPYKVRKFVGRHRALVAAGLAAGAVAAVAGALLVALSTSRPPRVLHAVQLTHFGLADGVVATDGKSIYFDQRKAGRTSIVHIPVEGGDPVEIPTPFRNVEVRDISPDKSELLAEGWEERDSPKALWRIALRGGSPQRVVDASSPSARWSHDGTKIAFSHEANLWVVRPVGSGPLKLAPGAGIDDWSPGGSLIRFSRVNGATGGMSLWEMRSDGTHLRPFLPERQNPGARWGEGQGPGVWTPDGRYFLFRESSEHKTTLWAIREQTQVSLLRRPRAVEIYAASFDIFPWAHPAITPDGKRLFLLGENESGEMVRYDKALRRFVPVLAGVSADSRGYSPDGKWIAYTTFADNSIWRARPDGSERRQLTFPPVRGFGGAWLPDSRRVAIRILPPGGKPGKICIVPVDGGKPEVLFENEPTAEDVATFSPDGRKMGFIRTWLDAQGNTTAAAACLLDLHTGNVSKLGETDDIYPPFWSPNGRYMATKTSGGELLLFDAAARKWRPLVRGVRVPWPVWSQDSKFIYYQDRSTAEGPLYRVAVPGGRVEPVMAWKLLFRGDLNRNEFAGLTPDGQPFANVVRRYTDVYALDLDLP
jgi:Tol biopolymer transport system component